MLFPLLAALHRDYPGAQVDAVVSGEGSGTLFADFPNFGRAFELPRSALRHPWTWIRVTRAISAERYDLAIDHDFDKGVAIRPLIRCRTSRRVTIEGI